MALVLGFDVYGTLVDPFGMERQLESLFGDRGSGICALWRQKQLEYSFRRGIMRCYEDFDACTERALSFAETQAEERDAHQVERDNGEVEVVEAHGKDVRK